MARVRLEKVTKYYGDALTVKGVDLDIAHQEFLVMVGPSGCGKSTTLRMIAGLEEISSGDLYIGERRMNDVPPKDRDIAMVFQNYALYPHMSVFENMSFALTLQKVSKDEIKRRVQEAADILAIGHLLERKPKQLSGGQRQRVAMGRAIVRDPAVFLFDEPLSNLDANLRVQMRVELSRLHQRLKTTIAYVTHDQVEAMTLASRIMVMKDGVVQQIGAPMELFHKPANAFVAGFIGSPSMNFLDAELSEEGGEVWLKGQGFSLGLDGRNAEAARASGGKALKVGIRPQDLAPGLASPAAVRCKVEVVEPLGAESYYHFEIGGKPMVGRSEGDVKVGVGQEAEFGVRLEHLHLFSADGATRLN
jgi:multiple sugar transport system ATP-binding protein